MTTNQFYYKHYYKPYKDFINKKFNYEISKYYSLTNEDKQDIKSELNLHGFELVHHELNNSICVNDYEKYIHTCMKNRLHKAAKKIIKEKRKYKMYLNEKKTKSEKEYFYNESHFCEVGEYAKNLFKKAELTVKEHIIFSSIWTGLSYADISKYLKMKEEAVRQVVSRARAKLQNTVKKTNIDIEDSIGNDVDVFEDFDW